MKKYNNRKIGHTVELIVPIIIIVMICRVIISFFFKQEIKYNNYKFINDLETMLSYDNYLIENKNNVFFKEGSVHNLINIENLSIDDFNFINKDLFDKYDFNFREQLKYMTEIAKNDFKKPEFSKEELIKYENRIKFLTERKEKEFFILNRSLYVIKNIRLLLTIKDKKSDNIITNQEYKEIIQELKDYFDLINIEKEKRKKGLI